MNDRGPLLSLSCRTSDGTGGLASRANFYGTEVDWITEFEKLILGWMRGTREIDERRRTPAVRWSEAIRGATKQMGFFHRPVKGGQDGGTYDNFGLPGV